MNKEDVEAQIYLRGRLEAGLPPEEAKSSTRRYLIAEHGYTYRAARTLVEDAYAAMTRVPTFDPYVVIAVVMEAVVRAGIDVSLCPEDIELAHEGAEHLLIALGVVPLHRPERPPRCLPLSG